MIKKNQHPFVVCVKNQRYKASLEVRKIYTVLPDEAACQQGLLRVIDESGEDYLYPIDFFVPLELPKKIENTLSATF